MTINTMKKLILLLLLLVSTNVFALTLEEQLNEKNRLETIDKNKGKLVMDNSVYLSCMNLSLGNILGSFIYNGYVTEGGTSIFTDDNNLSPTLIESYNSKDYVLFDKIVNDKELKEKHISVPYTKDNHIVTWQPYKKMLTLEYHMDTNRLYYRTCESCPIVTFQCEIKSEKKDIQ